MPAVALARTLRERGHEPMLVTVGREVERTMLARELLDLPALPLPGGDSRRPSPMAMPFWIGRATLAARRLLQQERVDCVVSTGGRASVPVGLAARSLGVPLYLLEQNAVTGRANRCLLPFARRMYLGLPPVGPQRSRALVTGTPLRREVGRVDRATARQGLGIDAAAQVVLVVGGSQGAQPLNTMVPEALAMLELADPKRVIVHLAGAGRDGEVARRYGAAADRLDARVLSGSGDMANLYAAADLVVCRGGGTTVAELAAVGRPAIIVPYPHHRDRQQLHNAAVLAARDAAVIIEERELSARWLADILRPVLADPLRLAAMGSAARTVDPGDAAARIVRDIETQNDWRRGDAE